MKQAKHLAFQVPKPRETWKARRARRATSKAKRNEKEQTGEEKLPQTTEAQPSEPPKKQNTREEQPAGLVLVDKNFEPLDALLQAYEARLKPLETLEERWKNYPDPAQEARQLEIFKRLTEATQALERRDKISFRACTSTTNETKRNH